MKKQKLNHFLKHGSLKTARIGMSRKAFKKQNLKRGKKHFSTTAIRPPDFPIFWVVLKSAFTEIKSPTLPPICTVPNTLSAKRASAPIRRCRISYVPYLPPASHGGCRHTALSHNAAKS